MESKLHDIAAGLIDHGQDRWFKGLEEIYRKRLENVVNTVLTTRGNCDFEKGEIQALKWVLTRPAEILKKAEELEHAEGNSSNPQGDDDAETGTRTHV